MGKTIRILRETKGMSRAELSEIVGISESHLKKIEVGTRRPGISTYQKIMERLGADLVIESDGVKTVKGNCIMRAQEILMDCTETQALYLLKVLEFSAKNIGSVS
nr:helix-turn-helix transcriptional regulator [uncultured Acetatifactor sp.]